MTRYRKAIAAFLTPFLALPLTGWATGDTPFDRDLLYSTAASAVIAVIVYFTPNTPASPVDEGNGTPATWGDDPPPVIGS